MVSYEMFTLYRDVYSPTPPQSLTTHHLMSIAEGLAAYPKLQYRNRSELFEAVYKAKFMVQHPECPYNSSFLWIAQNYANDPIVFRCIADFHISTRARVLLINEWRNKWPEAAKHMDEQRRMASAARKERSMPSIGRVEYEVKHLERLVSRCKRQRGNIAEAEKKLAEANKRLERVKVFRGIYTVDPLAGHELDDVRRHIQVNEKRKKDVEKVFAPNAPPLDFMDDVNRRIRDAVEHMKSLEKLMGPALKMMAEVQ